MNDEKFNGLILDESEIVRITGFVRKADQRRWFKNHHWKFEVSALGWPVVSRKHAERMLDGEQATNQEWSPNRSVFAKKAA